MAIATGSLANGSGAIEWHRIPGLWPRPKGRMREARYAHVRSGVDVRVAAGTRTSAVGTIDRSAPAGRGSGIAVYSLIGST